MHPRAVQDRDRAKASRSVPGKVNARAGIRRRGLWEKGRGLYGRAPPVPLGRQGRRARADRYQQGMFEFNKAWEKTVGAEEELV